MSKRFKANPFTREEKKCRYFTPKITEVQERFVRYENAQKFAHELKVKKNERVVAIVNGSFIFGDFIEAYLTTHQIRAKKMTLSTLSYNENNVDSMKTLMVKRYVDNLNIIVSDYFFGHERAGMIPYTYRELDSENNTFQLAVDRTHCKMYIWETYFNEYYVIQGSVNLRSSGNSENFTIEENEKLYRWCDEYLTGILDRQKSIDKSLKFKKSWHQVQKEEAVVAAQVQEGKAPQAQEGVRHCRTAEHGTREWERHFDEFTF
jgi:hypothetical protein